MKTLTLGTGKALAFCLIFSATAAFAQKPTAMPGHASPVLARQHKATIPNAKYPEEAAVIERIRARFRFSNNGTSDEVQFVRVKIQAQPAIQAWGQLIIGYNSSTEKIHVDFVRVLKPDGKVVTAGPNAIENLSSPVTQIAPVYTSLRQLHINVPSLGIGDTLEYQIETKTIHPLIPGQFFLDWDFSRHEITLNETLTVNVPKGRTIKVKTANGAAAPTIQDKGQRQVYTWHSSFTHRPKPPAGKNAKKKKKRTPPKFPDVQISTFTSWAQVGRWYAKLERPQAAVTAPVRAEAAELVKGHKTTLGKVKAIYDYVAENIRYVSLSFGIGQYQPHPAAEVLSNQYGDCKDKATLFQALLAAEGIQSYPVLINAVAKVDPSVPSPGQFDHLINVVKVDGQTYWADTTPGVTPFGFLLPVLRYKWALVVPDKTAPKLERTPENPPFMPTQKAVLNAKVNDLGGMKGTFSLTMTGSAAAIFRNLLMDRLPKNEWPKAAKVLTRAMVGKQAKVSHSHFSNPGDLDRPLRFHTQFSEPAVVDMTDQQTTLALPTNEIDLVNPAQPEAGSKQPLKLGGIHDETMKWTVQLPPQFSVSLPVPVHLTRDYAEYDATYTIKGKTLTAERHLILRKAKLPASRYDDYEAFLSAVNDDLAQEVSLTNSAPGMGTIPKDMSADDLYRAGVAAVSMGNFKEAAKLMAAVAKKDPTRRNIWSISGYTYLQAKEFDKAVAAFKKQIAKNPFDPHAYDYLGSAYSAMGRYDDAVKEYKKQLQVNPLQRFAREDLGSTYLLQKKYALAEPQLKAAIKLDPNNPELEINIGSDLLGLHKDSEALQWFQKAMSASATPTVWNNIAYTMSQHSTNLGMATQLADNAIRATEAQLNATSLDTMSRMQAAQVESISAYWDTMGWILYKEGKVKQARSYARAAWMLTNDGSVGDHLGRIDEKLGRKAAAIRAFALALAYPGPPVGTRARLVALVGKDKVDSLIASATKDLAARRRVKLANPDQLTAKAQFWVLFSPGGKSSRKKATRARVENVKFISGSDSLKPYAQALRKARFAYLFPPGEQTKLAVRGVLSCSKAKSQCSYTPFSANKAVLVTPGSGSGQRQ